MTCDQLVDLLPEALTAPALPAEVEAHLAGCAACRAEAEAVRALVARVRESFPPEAEVAPPPLAAILAAARAESPEPLVAAPRGGSAWLARAAALLLAAGLGALLDRSLAPRSATPDAPSVRSAAELHLAAREAVAERPGGLGASLAVLGALSAQSGETGASGRR